MRNPPRREGSVVLAALGSPAKQRACDLLPRGADVLHALHVSGLEAFRSLGEVEFHCLALVQAPVSVLLDSREMYEDILARRSLDESVSFGSVKPLDCTFLSHNLLLSPDDLGIIPAARTFRAEP